MEKNKAKSVIQKHVKNMLVDLDKNEQNVCWLGEDSEEIIADIIFSTLKFGKDVENYMEKEGMLKEA